MQAPSAQPPSPAEAPSRAPAELDSGRRRVIVEGLSPCVDGGRHAAKRTLGELVIVEADVFGDGHDLLGAALLVRAPDEETPRTIPMVALGNDRWRATFTADRLGRWRYRVVAWVDHFETWRTGTLAKVRAGQDVSVEMQVGAALVDEVAVATPPGDPRARELARLASGLRTATPSQAAARLSDERLVELVQATAPRHHASSSDEIPIVVDPQLARFSTWYELFPRSASPDPSRPGTLADVEARLPYVAEMGFDVLYLPPISPIGRSFRKGPNNATEAGPDDPGSPWAIGAAEGGHDAVHPELGTEADLRRLVATARGMGIEVALDIAFQCSPDHPWVREHPTWFRWRPDGTVQYAENPPKKYQDIYPLEFESPDWQELWEALAGVVRHWIAAGVTVFRVDNPHTKPLPFWEWLITSIKADHPEVLFLAEAFTRPRVMHGLAKLGFSQSYTYFTWRNSAAELREYFTELSADPSREYFRPNVWPNTPDILHEHLQTGGRPAFVERLVLAATLASSYGVYGPVFELSEGRAREAGSEEYLDSEKYQVRHWDLDRPDSLRHLIARVNRIRRENPALQHDWSLAFHDTDNPALLAYSKVAPVEATGPEGEPVPATNAVLCVVNVDPHNPQSGWVDVDPAALRCGPGPFRVTDLLGGGTYQWSAGRNYVQLDPRGTPAHIFRVSAPA